MSRVLGPWERETRVKEKGKASATTAGNLGISPVSALTKGKVKAKEKIKAKGGKEARKEVSFQGKVIQEVSLGQQRRERGMDPRWVMLELWGEGALRT